MKYQAVAALKIISVIESFRSFDDFYLVQSWIEGRKGYLSYEFQYAVQLALVEKLKLMNRKKKYWSNNYEG